MKTRVGPPVTGDDFFPRQSVIDRLVRTLRRGNVSFLGPRRTGKTSILRAIKSAPPDEYIGVLINLEKHHTVAAWLEDMIAAAKGVIEQPNSAWQWAHDASKALTTFLKRVETIDLPGGGGVKLTPSAAKEWRPTADAFLKLLVDSRLPVLFLLDEFPWFLELVAKNTSADDVKEVLSWFRDARQTLSDHPARFLVTGSIGLDGLVRRLGLSPTVNEFDTVVIPPLSDEEALSFLEDLACGEHVAITATGRKQIVQLLGANWPILLQLFISEIQEWQIETGKGAPSKTDLQRLYREKLVGGSRNKYCSEMWERLPKTFTDGELRLAREILKEVRLSSTGMVRDQLEAIHARLVPDDAHRALVADELDNVLDTLRHDGYILKSPAHENRTVFASNILRDYWIQRLS